MSKSGNQHFLGLHIEAKPILTKTKHTKAVEREGNIRTLHSKTRATPKQGGGGDEQEDPRFWFIRVTLGIRVRGMNDISIRVISVSLGNSIY